MTKKSKPKINAGIESGSKSKVNPGYVPHQSLIGTPDSDATGSLILFSFKYFRQQKHFGLSGSKVKWFIALLDRLKNLNDLRRKDFLSNNNPKSHRVHPIDWNAPNIPVSFEDLDLKRVTTPEEVYQVQISKAKGRIVGFFKEKTNIFYVVLLDHDHNIQPWKGTVHQNNIIEPSYTAYEANILNALDTCTSPACLSCNFYTNVKVATKYSDSHLVTASVDEELLRRLDQLEDQGITFKSILESGVEVWES